jgi:hypothetical protein
MGAEDHAGGAPLDEEVQGAVANFHKFLCGSLKVVIQPQGHIPLLAGSGINAQYVFEQLPVHRFNTILVTFW